MPRNYFDDFTRGYDWGQRQFTDRPRLLKEHGEDRAEAQQDRQGRVEFADAITVDEDAAHRHAIQEKVKQAFFEAENPEVARQQLMEVLNDPVMDGLRARTFGAPHKLVGGGLGKDGKVGLVWDNGGKQQGMAVDFDLFSQEVLREAIGLDPAYARQMAGGAPAAARQGLGAGVNIQRMPQVQGNGKGPSAADVEDMSWYAGGQGPAQARAQSPSVKVDGERTVNMKEDGSRDFTAFLGRTRQLESSGGRNLVNPNSSARGNFQWMPETAAEFGLDWNQLASGEVDEAPAATQLAQRNQRQLQRAIGRAPEDWELYLAHQQGGGGAARLLRRADEPAVDVVGRQQVLGNGGREDMTAGEFAQLWRRKYEGAPQLADAASEIGQPGSGSGGSTAVQAGAHEELPVEEPGLAHGFGRFFSPGSIMERVEQRGDKHLTPMEQHAEPPSGLSDGHREFRAPQWFKDFREGQGRPLAAAATPEAPSAEPEAPSATPEAPAPAPAPAPDRRPGLAAAMGLDRDDLRALHISASGQRVGGVGRPSEAQLDGARKLMVAGTITPEQLQRFAQTGSLSAPGTRPSLQSAGKDGSWFVDPSSGKQFWVGPEGGPQKELKWNTLKQRDEYLATNWGYEGDASNPGFLREKKLWDVTLSALGQEFDDWYGSSDGEAAMAQVNSAAKAIERGGQRWWNSLPFLGVRDNQFSRTLALQLAQSGMAAGGSDREQYQASLALKEKYYQPLLEAWKASGRSGELNAEQASVFTQVMIEMEHSLGLGPRAVDEVLSLLNTQEVNWNADRMQEQMIQFRNTR